MNKFLVQKLHLNRYALKEEEQQAGNEDCLELMENLLRPDTSGKLFKNTCAWL